VKIVRYEQDGRVRPGVVVADGVVDLSPRWPSVIEIVRGGPGVLGEVAAFVAGQAPSAALADVRLVAPIERPGKYLAIGMNYRKHLEEADKFGIQRSAHQVWFNKQTTCLSGPFDEIDPGVTEQLDYEAELGVVIGRPCKHVGEAQARDYVFGYFVANDVSARDFQFHSPTFTMGKSFDTHGPIGPWIVTADEAPDPHTLDIRCLVNGELRQSSNTSQMIANIWAQVAYLSQAFTLEPGDLLATGTPEGVGIARDPQVFLKPGDVVRCEIEGLGAIENRVAAA